MIPLRTLLVDDEPPARNRLRRLLAAEERIHIIGEARDGLEALELIEELAPDLLFLDIQMPELDGFQVLENLDAAIAPRVIFVTAYDEFAVRAFEVRAVDYLMKPVAADRLNSAVDNLIDSRTTTDARAIARQIAEERAPLDRFIVRGASRLSLVRAGEVRWIEASGNYARLHTEGGTHLVRTSLNTLEGRLDPSSFVRIHRSTIVHLDAIVELRPIGHSDFVVLLRDGTELRLSRRYRDRLPAGLDG